MTPDDVRYGNIPELNQFTEAERAIMADGLLIFGSWTVKLHDGSYFYLED